MRTIATLACRNNSTRLYGKPMQYLENKTVLEYICKRIEPHVAEIVLAISEADGNECFESEAKRLGVKFVIGDDQDVLKRLINACELAEGDTVFRVTTESPFCYTEGIKGAIESHESKKADYTTIGKLPDGCGFELISLSSLRESHEKGKDHHRSELCEHATLYINENQDKFKMNILSCPENLLRPGYRLTIDYPEDLILCRKVIRHFKGDKDAGLSLAGIIKLLDGREDLRNMVKNIEDENYIKPYH